MLKDDCLVEIRPHCLTADDLKSFDGILRLFADNMSDYAIYMLDPQGRVATWNLGAERLNGHKQGEVLGRNFSMFFSPDAVDAGEPARQLPGFRRSHDGRGTLARLGGAFCKRIYLRSLYGIWPERRIYGIWAERRNGYAGWRFDPRLDADLSARRRMDRFRPYQ